MADPLEPAPPDLAPALARGQDIPAGERLEPALGELFEALSDARQAPFRLQRVQGLIRLGRAGDRRALPALLAAADDADWVMRNYAVSGLGLMGAPEGAPAVARALLDARPEVRRAAARSLKRLDGGDRLDDWLVALGDPDWLVREAALEALADYAGDGPEQALLATLTDPVWLNRYQALKGLAARQGPHVLEALVAALQTDKELAPWLAPAIADYGPPALPGLLALLADAPPWRKLAIASALGRLDDERARSALATLVGHPDAEIETAVRLQGGAMRAYLAQALGEADWMVRWHACKLLGGLGEPAAGVSLLPLLQDPRPDVRLAALDALKHLAPPDAEADLRRCLEDASWRIRQGAVEALAALGTERALGTLVEALADAHFEVRSVARRCLGAQGHAAEPALEAGLLRQPASYDEIAWLLKALRRETGEKPPCDGP